MSLLSHVLNLIFPAICKNCDSIVSADAATSYFCKNCWTDIEWFDCPCCPQCGLPYASGYIQPRSEQSPVSHLCGNCREKPPCFDKVVSAGPYNGVLSEAIRLFKYKKKVHFGKILTEWALKSPLVANAFTKRVFSDESILPLYLIPVPLHYKRLRVREFNQSAIMASVISNKFGIPVLTNILMRHHHTKPQVELGGMDRRENVAGAFSIEDSSLIEGKEIILVDDVYTSGSTVNECAKVMKKNGAEKVYVVTIARMVG